MTLRALSLLLAATIVACGPPPPHAWLEAGSIVPSAEDDAAIAQQIDDADGVEREVLRVSGFAEGMPAVYWDLGVVDSAATMPIYLPCRRTTARCVPIDHPPIVDALPGEPGYSHYGRVYEVEVSDRWAGEIIPSRAAIDDAVRDGLASAPVETDRYVHCPIVHRDVRVEVADETFASPSPVYVRGVEASCIAFYATHGQLTLDDATEGTLLERNVYALFREGDAMPISEAARGVDLTGDGDMRDTNTILGVSFTSRTYTPLWRVVRVVVPSAYASIDTSADETVADYRAATDMFTVNAEYEITPIAGSVVDHEITDTLVDCPIQSAPGML